MVTSVHGLIARDYRRLSDKGGNSVDDQGAENRTAAAEQGWTLAEPPYVDDGFSASRYARKRRTGFDQLVADLQTGPTGRESDFGADVLMLWESSRGSRRVGEWVSFIELLEDKGVRIWVTTHERLYDPANGRDRKQLIDDATDSEYESYKTHRRVSRTAPREAARGRPYGGAPYGLRPVYDPANGKLLTWTEDETRSHVIRALFDLLEKGQTPADVQREFLARGYLNASGNPFGREQLRQMAVRHAYAGLRYYKGTVYKGVWDGLVPEEQFWTVYRRLTAPERLFPGGKLRHVVTAALWCGRCDTERLTTRYRTGKRDAYICKTCNINVGKDDIDALLIGTADAPGVLLEYVARPDVYGTLRAPAADSAEIRRLRVDLARARGERDELRGATGATLAEVRVLANSLSAKESEVLRLEVRERELTVPPEVLSIVKPGQDVWASWDAAPIRAKRLVAQMFLSPQYLGRPCVMPSRGLGYRPSAEERIEWRVTPPGESSPPARRP